MKKICLLLAIIIVLFSGCDSSVYNWKFDYDIEQIKEIKIIEISNFYEHEYSVVKDISYEQFSQICDDIMNIEMKKYGVNLSHPTGYCILIIFDNDEYDIIASKESKRFRYQDGEIVAYNTWLDSDDSQFKKIIHKYLGK